MCCDMINTTCVVSFLLNQKNEPLEIAVPRGSYLSFNAKNIITENLSQYSKRLIFVVI